MQSLYPLSHWGTLAVQSLRPTVVGGATGGAGASETLAWGPWSGMSVL